jgi:UDP-N-acetyl-D-mannosaminuronic acid dehydrogenase
VRLEGLRAEVKDRSVTLGVVGLGYVGLPVACLFADAGFQVVGIDVKADRVATINAGVSPIEGNEPGLAELLERVVTTRRLRATCDYGAARDCGVVTINVETPVDADHAPRYDALRSALLALGPQLKPGALVIVESTIAPGTMAQLVAPLLEQATGRRVNQGFFLGHCPERVMPGKLLANLRSVSRVCGGASPETSEVMIELYRHVVAAELDAADCLTAELVKTAENAYRDVNIAFANELALICEALGGDVWTVRDLVNKSPGRNVLLPGAGVGGHCIPKDPWLLVHGALGKAPVRLIPASREVNDSMPAHVAQLTVDALAEAGIDVAGARVAVLGYAYLEDSDDTRNSPSIQLVTRLEERGADVRIHDPYVAAHRGELSARVQGCDAVVLVIAHDAYRGLDLADLRGWLASADENGAATPKVLVDGRHVFDRRQAENAGFVFRAIGVGT